MSFLNDNKLNSQMLFPDSDFALLVTQNENKIDLLDWLADKVDEIKSSLIKTPVILFRDFDLSKENFHDFSQLFGELLNYEYRSTPRTEESPGIYTATEYPSSQEIPQHCENAYQSSWPMNLVFFCQQPAKTGGQTPIADVRVVSEQIDDDIKRLFKNKKVMYVRNYSSWFDIPWQSVFQTESKTQVERYCREKNIQYEWKDDGTLKTIQVCDAMAKHPDTGEVLWFNQAHLFHITNLEKSHQDSLLSVCGKENLPRNTYFGDGSEIDEAILMKIRKAFSDNKHTFDWGKGDLMLVDNMLASHGRNKFEGERKVLVSMLNLESPEMKK